MLRRERRYLWDAVSPSWYVDKDALTASSPSITPPTVSPSRHADRDALPVPTALAIYRSVPHTQVASPFPEPAAPINLTDHITRDTALFKRLGWRQFVEQRRSRSDFASLNKVDHPAQRLLKFYEERGAPVKMATESWSQDRISAALARGAHRSCMGHIEFLHEEFNDMILKSQWVVLPAEEVMHLPVLRVSPPGGVPQRDRETAVDL